MKTNHLISSLVRAALAAALATIPFTSAPAYGAHVIVPSSLMSLAAKGTDYYTFQDPTSGESVIIKVAMTPVAGPFNVVSFGTRAGIGIPPAMGADAIQATEGVDITANLMFASRGVVPGTVQFQIGSLGMRVTPTYAPPSVTWRSSAVTRPGVAVAAETPYILDVVPATIGGATYTASLRHDAGMPVGGYQLSDAGAAIAGQGIVMHAWFNTIAADPHAGSWLTRYANEYAKIYPDDTYAAPVSTWMRGSFKQLLPAYAGVQEIHSTSNEVVIRSTGLDSEAMGPWYDTIGGLPILLPNLPTNQHSLWRFPRGPRIPAAKTVTSAGAIGYFINGVSIFDPWAAKYYDGAADVFGTTAPGGFWNVNAQTESPTFDPNRGHPQGQGIYHFHDNPLAVRYLAHDHVDYNASTRTYHESAEPVVNHSPIIGWMQDGFPLYGPYGYRVPNNPASGVRNMRSGFWQRDGTHGTVSITGPGGRASRPLWVQRLYSTAGLLGSSVGPDVSTTSPLGQYIEDYDYLGDHGYALGMDYDLDEFNGRWCVTPEFPQGTYAYFVTIDDLGQPAFPYIIGRAFFGDPTPGGPVTAVPVGATTVFDSMTSLRPVLGKPSFATPGGVPTVTLTWNGAIEGGIYEVSRSSDLKTWTTLPTTVTAAGLAVTAALPLPLAALGHQMFRVALSEISQFDPATSGPGPGTSMGILSVSPYSMPAEVTVTVAIKLGGAMPAGAPSALKLVKAGVPAPGTFISRAGNIITAKFDLRGLSGTYDVVAEFTVGGGVTTGSLNGGFIVK